MEKRINIMHYLSIRQIAMGGAENCMLTLCEHLDKSRMNLMISSRPIDERGEDLLRRARAIDVPVKPLKTGSDDKIGYVKKIVELALLLRKEKIDVLHVHCAGFTGLHALLAAQLARVPGIVMTHQGWFGSQPHSRVGKLSLWLEKTLAGRILALYTGQANEMVEAGIPRERISIVPNGIDFSKFHYRRDRAAEGRTSFKLIIVARLVEGKGHKELLSAFRLLAPQHPHLQLQIVGDGPLREEINNQIEELGLREGVEMVGQVSYDSLPDLYRAADVAVLPSYMPGELFPHTLLESMAIGLPAIGTNYVGIPDIIADGETGLLVEPRDVQGLAAAIEKMVSDPAITARMGQRARSKVEKDFSVQVISRRVMEIYREAASAHRGRRKTRWQAAQDAK